jgi:hypothetical protein
MNMARPVGADLRDRPFLGFSRHLLGTVLNGIFHVAATGTGTA